MRERPTDQVRDGSSPVAAQARQPSGHPILALQQAIGNHATIRLLSRQPSTRTREVGITEHDLPAWVEDVMPRDLLPGERTRIERFVADVRAELTHWGDFRRHFAERGEPPGRAAFRAAREFSRWVLDRYGPPGPNSYTPELTNYLANRLTSEQLGFMREMIAFAHSFGGQYGNAEILRELFNDPQNIRMPLIDLRHSYNLASAGPSRSRSRGMVGRAVDNVAIHYSNSLGWTYDKPLRIRQAELGATISVPPSGPNSRSYSFSATSLTGEGPQRTRRYWPPEYFEGLFLMTRFSAGGGVSIGPIDAGTANFTVLCNIQFSEGSDTMDFRGELGLSTSVAGDDGVSGDPTERNLRLRAALSAQLVLRGGWASGNGPIRQRVRPASGPRPGRHREGLLFETHLYFPTGSSRLDEAAQATLTELVTRMRGFTRSHPRAHYAISVEAHASRRWRSARGDERRAGQLNDRLARARADTAAHFVNRAFLRANPDPAASHIDILLGGQPRGWGALRAIQRGADEDEDEWRDRRLDVLVYFREIEPHSP